MLVRNIIRDLKAQGTTVFLNSHLLGEVEATCDRVSFIKEGRVIRNLTLNDLQADRMIVDVLVDAVTPSLMTALEEVTGHSVQVMTNGARPAGRNIAALASLSPVALELTLLNEDMLPLIAERTLANGTRLYALTPRRMSLEQLFLEIVGTEDSGQ
jgi:ABC-2 type transport system ATP-binding protein